MSSPSAIMVVADRPVAVAVTLGPGRAPLEFGVSSPMKPSRTGFRVLRMDVSLELSVAGLVSGLLPLVLVLTMIAFANCEDGARGTQQWSA
jgi:hypothetical protein